MSRREFLKFLVYILSLAILWKTFLPKGRYRDEGEEREAKEYMYILSYHGDYLKKREVVRNLPRGNMEIHFMKENPPWERVLVFLKKL